MDECWHRVCQVVARHGFVTFDLLVLFDGLLTQREIRKSAAFLSGVFNSFDFLPLMNLLLLQLRVQLIRDYNFLRLDNIYVTGNQVMRRLQPLPEYLWCGDF